MTEDEQRANEQIADCAKAVSARILSDADKAGLDRLSFLVNVAAVLASSALAAQPEDQLQGASRHLQNALRLVHCLEDAPDPINSLDGDFTAPETLQ
jgi:hypothetical protein